MKPIGRFFYGLLILLGGMTLWQGCTQVKTPKLESPETTFATMVAAINEEDLDTYEDCWYGPRAEGEGLVSQLTEDSDIWEGLQRMFHTDSKLVDRTEAIEHGMKIVSYEVETPGIENGEHINAVSFVQDGKSWKMYHW